jgi:hypothetical protein
MTRYWMKIALGALLIFVIGMGLNFGVRKGVRTVHSVTETADPITIPIRFATFRVDGVALGKLRELRLLRSAPKEVSSAEITVRLDSAASADRLSACTLRLDDLEKIDERTTFVCVTADNPGMPGAFEPFGEVKVEGTDIVLPLLLPAAAVRDFRSEGAANAAADAEAAAQAADSAASGAVAPPAPVPAAPKVQATPASPAP